MLEPKQITVVLDSTEITRDWYLRGLNFKLLSYLNERSGISVAVPASVIEEVCANHHRSQEEARRSLARAIKEFSRLGLNTPTEPPTSDNYRRKLKEALDVLGVGILDWPKVSHEELTLRAVNRRPPFDLNGSGYRDSLVWAAVLDLGKLMADTPWLRNPHIVMVSHDLIFSNGKGSLNPSLAEEVAALGISVELRRDLQQWIIEQLPESGISRLPDIAARARDERLEQLLTESDYFENLDLDIPTLGLPRSTGAVTILAAGNHELEAVKYTNLPNGGTLVEYTLEVKVELEAEMSREDAEANHWDYQGTSPANRVWAEVPMTLAGKIEAIFDEYDYDFELELRDLRPSDYEPPVRDTGIGAPDESWNTPLPIFSDDEIND